MGTGTRLIGALAICGCILFADAMLDSTVGLFMALGSAIGVAWFAFKAEEEETWER